jgi:hypothetical protein
MLRELLSRPIVKRQRKCEGCGNEFQCEIGLKGCWCTEIKLTDEQRADMKEKFSDCLCKDCLTSYPK